MLGPRQAAVLHAGRSRSGGTPQGARQDFGCDLADCAGAVRRIDKRKQHSAEFKARVAMAALSGEKTLAEWSSEFGVLPTMINTWKQELMKRASELFARGNKAPAVDDAQKLIDDLHRKIGQLQVERDFLAGQPVLPRQCIEPGAHRCVVRRRAAAAGLQTASWITVDDTGARHAGRNGFCTHIGNDSFTWFGTRASKSRLNFLDLLRAGHGEYVINAAALAYMRIRSLAGPVLSRLAAERQTRFVDHTAWQAHLRGAGVGSVRSAEPDSVAPSPTTPPRLGIGELHVTPDPVCIATEGALWGAVAAHGFLQNAVIVSDDAGQFAVGQHALCWVHAERLVHKLDTFTDLHRAIQERMRDLIWWFYADLKAYRTEPTARRRSEMRARFDRIFHRRTGFATLDRLLERLHANKPELLMVLDRPEFRCTPTVRSATSAATSSSARSAAGPAAMPAVIAATRFLV